jgi:hypothetical protein
LAASFHSVVLAEWKRVPKRGISLLGRHSCVNGTELFVDGGIAQIKYESNLNQMGRSVARAVVVMRPIVVAGTVISRVHDHGGGYDIGARPRSIGGYDASAQRGDKTHKDQ